MTLQQIQYAVTIAECGSMNKAAEKLYISQPSLTSAVQELEKELNFPIFHRSAKGAHLTQDGGEFLQYAKQVLYSYESMMERYGNSENIKKKFGVSAQHYSFAVKAFVELVKKYDTSRYEFAIRETKTRDIIQDVATLRSEIGILYLSQFNRTAIQKILKSNQLKFHSLLTCNAYVYLWAKHPLASRKSITFEELKEYPCLSFEQGDSASFYYAEEILSTQEYTRIIKACDRATMLNLMIGLNGYTLCSGIICEELNGDDYIAIPFRSESALEATQMEIGYITKENTIPTPIAVQYIEEIKHYLKMD